MKKLRLLVLLLISAWVVLPVAAVRAQDAEEGPKTLLGDFFKEHDIALTGSGTLDYYDKYVWRGQYLDTDGVLQPGVSLSAKGLTVGYWGSYDMENTDTLTSDESDVYVSYTYTFENIASLTGGHTWYAFPEYNTSSKEFFFTLAFPVLLSPSLSFFHDYEDGKELNTDGTGNYYNLNLSYSLPLFQQHGVSLELATAVGYVDGQWLSGQGWHVTPTLGLKIPLTPNVSITPTIGYNIPFEDLEDPAIGNQPDRLFGGVKTAFTF